MSLLENGAKNFSARFQANTFHVDKIYATWSICLKKITVRQKPDRKLTVLIEEKLENIHATFETSPSKYSVTTSLGDVF
jgi:hypothetical protein